MGRLFGTDGIRGVAGHDLTAELALRLGRAAVAVLGEEAIGRPTFVLGRDTRASGEFLEAAITAGICSSGGDVLTAGVIPTPAVALLTTELGADCGIVISASHNPPEYNGIKFFAREGHKLPDHLEDEMEDRMPDRGPGVGAMAEGRVRSVDDARERYLAHLTNADGASERSLAGLKLVVDCANGAASDLAPEAYRRLGAEVVAVNDRPDGTNINVRCGAMFPEVVAAEVERHAADAGVAHDGDADRAMFADARGRVVDGDQVLAACALALHREGRLDGATVVSTVMANLGFHKAMAHAGIEVVAARVGDRYVLEEMRRIGAVLGGEQSGHIIFGRRGTTGDGIFTAATFLSLAARTGSTVEELASSVRRYPQVLLNVEVVDRDGLDEALELWAAVEKAERALGPEGRILVRASGTEPVVRVMVEAETEEDAATHAERVAQIVRKVLNGAG
jgi:phosphoglucosamine mutase